MQEQATTTEVIYKDVVGFPDYLVGSDGSIWSKKGGTPREIRGWVERRCETLSYRTVALMRDLVEHNRHVHVLVLEAFIGPRPVKFHGCHNDGNGLNNTVGNLRWDTPQNNALDRFHHEAARKGREAPRRKTDAEIAAEASRLPVNEMTYRQIGEAIGVSFSRAYRAMSRAGIVVRKHRSDTAVEIEGRSNVTEKTCQLCGKLKPVSEFYRHRSMLDGYRGICKPCHCADSVERARARRKREREAALA